MILMKGVDIMEFDELMSKEGLLLNGYKNEFRKLNDSKNKVLLYDLRGNNFLLIEYKDKTIPYYDEVVKWLGMRLNAIVRYIKKNKNVIIWLNKPCQELPTMFKVYQYDEFDVSTMFFTKMSYDQIIEQLDDKKIVDIQVTDADRKKAEKDMIKYNKEHGTNY